MNKEIITNKNKEEEILPHDIQAKKEAERLIKQAKELEKSEAETLKSRAKYATVFACIFGAKSFLLVLAITVMMPLKTIEPWVIRVDTTTGYTEVATALENNIVSPDEALTRYFLSQYVLSRESYDWFLISHNHNKVRAMSSSTVFDIYDRQLRSDSGPLEILGQNRRAEVRIINISHVDNVAHVRFNKRIVNRDGTIDPNIPSRNWIATINYEFPNDRLNRAQRLINPLNFRVIGYSVEQESGVSE